MTCGMSTLAPVELPDDIQRRLNVYKAVGALILIAVSDRFALVKNEDRGPHPQIDREAELASSRRRGRADVAVAGVAPGRSASWSTMLRRRNQGSDRWLEAPS